MNVSRLAQAPPAQENPSQEPAPAPRAKRMALLNIRKGRIRAPMRVLVYGAEKVGKSTFAAGAPAPIFLGADNGTEQLDIARMPQPTTWAEVLEAVETIEREPHEYQTLVVDPLNWLEPLCHRHVVGDSGKTIEQFDGGYGRGYSAAVDLWREFKDALERCWERRRMNIVICAHVQVKRFENPEGPAYDRYELAMHARAAGMFKQWVDAVLFARHETFAKIDPTTKKAKGVSTGARIMHTQPSAAYDAGARWRLPGEMALSWAELEHAIAHDGTTSEEILAGIETMLLELSDPQVEKKVRAYVAEANKNATRLTEIANAVAKKLNDRKEQGS